MVPTALIQSEDDNGEEQGEGGGRLGEEDGGESHTDQKGRQVAARRAEADLWTTTSIRITNGSGRCKRRATRRSTSRSASISAGCTTTVSRACAKRSRARGLGALLSFDQHNIRYTTSTVIGEWARDKLLRYSLITGNGDPYIWDFGSAAKHHKLYAPWLHNDHCRAGMLGMRGAVGSRHHAVPRRGARDQGDPGRGGRRPHAGRRRRRRAADAVRAAEGRHRGARRSADDAARARDQERTTRSRC